MRAPREHPELCTRTRLLDLLGGSSHLKQSPRAQPNMDENLSSNQW